MQVTITEVFEFIAVLFFTFWSRKVLEKTVETVKK